MSVGNLWRFPGFADEVGTLQKLMDYVRRGKLVWGLGVGVDSRPGEGSWPTQTIQKVAKRKATVILVIQSKIQFTAI